MSQKRLLIDGKYHCVDCRAELNVSLCPTIKPVRCKPCMNFHTFMRKIMSGQRIARSLTHKAIRDGELPNPKNFTCTDCPRPATVYDHRDYGEPLKVEPVCQSCNVKRGAATPAWGIPPELLRA